MKVKIRRSNSTGEMVAEYFKVNDKTLFRFNVLKSIFKNETDITIIIDTNQRVNEIPAEGLNDYLSNSGLIYSIFPTDANKVCYFGIPLDFSRKKKQEMFIIMRITADQFTPKLFQACMENYDIGVGINHIRDINDISSGRLLDAEDILFNSSYFEKSLYDSVLCASIRSSFDIEANINYTE